MSRRDQVLLAAVAVLGERGTRHLTHRAVDERAGLPAGSTSNAFRTREALLRAVIGHLAAAEWTAWEAVAGAARPDSPTALAAALAAYARHATAADRTMTLARYAVFVEVAIRPELRGDLGGARGEILRLSASWLAAAGSAAPDEHCRVVLDHLEGIILHQVTFPDPAFDPLPELTALLNALIKPRC